MSIDPRSNYESDLIDLQKLFGNLWRSKYLIISFVFFFILLGKYYASSVATSIYASTAVVILDQRESDVADLGNVLGGLTGDSETLNSEVEVIRSRSLIEKVVSDLNLLSDPEFNPNLRQPSKLGYWLEKAKKIIDLEKAEASAFADDRREVITAVDILLRKLTVRAVPKTVVIHITAETTSGEKSASIAQAVAETYVQDQIRVKISATEEATTWLTNRVSDLQVEVERSQAEAKFFRAGTELVTAETLAAREIQLKDIRERLQTTRSSRQGDVEDLATLEGNRTPSEIVRVTKDNILSRLLPNLESSPEAQQAFNNRVDLLTSQIKNRIARADSEIRSLEASATALSAQVTRQNEELIQLQQLERAANTNLVLYEHFLTRLKETSVQQGLHGSDSRVLSRAEVPLVPTSPKEPLILAVCTVLGAMFGTAFVLLRDIGASVYRTAEELENYTGRPVLGQIPALPFKDRDKVLSYLDENRTSPISEAVRNFRTSIFLSTETPPQVVCISSSVPGEGKSTLSLALAQNISQMGKKVLVIEGDMRRRIFTKFSETTSEKGFVSVINKEVPLEDAVIYNPDIGADVLYAERGTLNPADLFASSEFSDLLDQLRATYDNIIIDSPPLLIVPDARIIARLVDAMLVVVKWDSTTSSILQDSLRELEKVGLDKPSLVLNQINFKKMQSYGYGGRYDSYQSYQEYGKT